MDSEIRDERFPIKLWLPAADLGEKALEQARNLANLPFAFRHVALMPDAHFGYGMPIGGVLATEGVVVPNAVGLDIGCGMRLAKTSLTEIDRETRLRWMEAVRKVVPVGFSHQAEPQDKDLMPIVEPIGVTRAEHESALRQLGTLGGGNHFIELQKGSDGFIYIMIHSGSRNLGKRVADHYNLLAKAANARWHSAVPREADLAFLPLDSAEGRDYQHEMAYCVEFAKANRGLMMRRALEVLGDAAGGVAEGTWDVAHNYAAIEHHFGRDVVVHRKGATRARQDEACVIPGSQGSSSFLCTGLGNRDSFASCSHGAGRCLGRKEAVRTLSLDAERKRLDDRGIVHSVRGQADLEEAAGAYKDIEQVMERQADLVRVDVRLEPLAVIKGPAKV
jgi:tRNA-splicing ligase RtcB